MKICVRCDKAIKPGEEYRTHAHDAASGPGIVNYSHVKCPKSPRR